MLKCSPIAFLSLLLLYMLPTKDAGTTADPPEPLRDERRCTTSRGIHHRLRAQQPGIQVRLRYEIRREFAPSVGVSLDRSFGEDATLVREEGGNPRQIQFVIGVRAWF